jgi:hypothetical protein
MKMPSLPANEPETANTVTTSPSRPPVMYCFAPLIAS